MFVALKKAHLGMSICTVKYRKTVTIEREKEREKIELKSTKD